MKASERLLSLVKVWSRRGFQVKGKKMTKMTDDFKMCNQFDEFSFSLSTTA